MFLLACAEPPAAAVETEEASIIAATDTDLHAGVSHPRFDPLQNAAAAARDLAAARSLDRFTVVVSGPWVVAGDGPPTEVHRRAQQTVSWASDQLRNDFFAHDPEGVWTIWMFEGDESYRRHARDLFGRTPNTPYGYADGDRRALVMDVTMGAGTIIHEMVHPYVAANLPGAPPWINEGLASLFEYTEERDGHIHGMINRRHYSVLRAIDEHRLPGVRTLAAMPAVDFYADTTGTAYGLSRHIMLYLQEHGFLRTFVARYTQAIEADPTGLDTLLAVTGMQEEALDTTLTAWALRLPR